MQMFLSFTLCDTIPQEKNISNAMVIYLCIFLFFTCFWRFANAVRAYARWIDVSTVYVDYFGLFWY